MTKEGIQFYRCTLCGTVVSPWDIQESKGCPKCKNNKIIATELSVWEKIVQIYKHPKVWGWEDAPM
jgi:predicted Zn-ribbon and HTH transcriptional regulator